MALTWGHPWRPVQAWLQSWFSHWVSSGIFTPHSRDIGEQSILLSPCTPEFVYLFFLLTILFLIIAGTCDPPFIYNGLCETERCSLTPNKCIECNVDVPCKKELAVWSWTGEDSVLCSKTLNVQSGFLVKQFPVFIMETLLQDIIIVQEQTSTDRPSLSSLVWRWLKCLSGCGLLLGFYFLPTYYNLLLELNVWLFFVLFWFFGVGLTWQIENIWHIHDIYFHIQSQLRIKLKSIFFS